MQHSQTHLRSRPIQAGYLRAFDAVARHLNFRLAAEEMALTQSAVSRQIQALEEEVGVPLFLRHTRAVELTVAGTQLLQAVAQALPRIDSTVRQIRQSAGRRHVTVTTFASFASMWLIPRLEAFQRAHPDIDIRVEASDTSLDLDVADVDIAVRYAPATRVPPSARRLFGESVTPMASPWLLKGGAPLKRHADVLQHTLIEASDAFTPHLEWLTWRRWLDTHGLARAQPKRWLSFNYAYQMTQAALSGQGIVLARPPLVAESLARGELVELFADARMVSPMAYWLLTAPRSAARAEVQAFADWLLAQAVATRAVVGEGDDPDLINDLD
ncbi:LysR substrate-binding domain-containing protein [Ottowia testudinis]|uniref:LysR family transcriptional regulator n=1 Tax=Ottowia testudinis TaxID=2816950 RepID=A0A975H2I8_9BURK|nr:LysR substrate-binding domain-containing protein [Ottowia testudinis]QTD44839.1 LysR family transcriptional regulator [Ottowia testudinis]